MPRLLLTALVAALVAALIALAARSLAEAGRGLRGRLAGAQDADGTGTGRTARNRLGETPMQRLSFVLLVALIFYAAIWGAG
ncbi:hypothetical protein [Palleronia rufa]|uniref:hypothetical protein n=1 Tax=Palleronia rufa TaxID=1530186 RepID=UPI00055B355E|nr:hypothetical protein [Palleronia rufa]